MSAHALVHRAGGVRGSRPRDVEAAYSTSAADAAPDRADASLARVLPYVMVATLGALLFGAPRRLWRRAHAPRLVIR